jgi:hypothetical protein
VRGVARLDARTAHTQPLFHFPFSAAPPFPLCFPASAYFLIFITIQRVFAFQVPSFLHLPVHSSSSQGEWGVEAKEWLALAAACEIGPCCCLLRGAIVDASRRIKETTCESWRKVHFLAADDCVTNATLCLEKMDSTGVLQTKLYFMLFCVWNFLACFLLTVKRE